jgi:hypothetical protein
MIYYRIIGPAISADCCLAGNGRLSKFEAGAQRSLRKQYARVTRLPPPPADKLGNSSQCSLGLQFEQLLARFTRWSLPLCLKAICEFRKV